MIRCISSSLFSANRLNSHIPDASNPDFFLCRYIYTSASILSWSPGVGFVERESGRAIPTASTKRRLSTHELFVYNPSIFEEPIWVINLTDLDDTFLLDVSINMKALVDYISRGVVIPGRKVILQLIREFRLMKESSQDGICYFENFIYKSLWNIGKPIVFHDIIDDPKDFLHSTRDFRPAAQKRVQNVSVSLHVHCESISTQLLRGQKNAVENMKYLEKGRS